MPAPKPASRVAQAADVLRKEVQSKGPGTRLSSVRELKARLGFSQASLAAAFEQLEREGLIERRHGSGVYASAQSDQVRIAVAMDPKFLLLANRSPIWHLVINSIFGAADAKGWSADLHLGAISPSVTGYSVLAPEALPTALLADLNNHRLSGAVCIGLSQGAVNVITHAGVPVASLAGYGQAMVEFHHRRLLEQGLKAVKQQGAGTVWVVASRLRDLVSLGEYAAKLDVRALACQLGEIEPVDKPLESVDPVQLGWQWARTVELNSGEAIVSCDDMLTVGIVMGLHSRGIEPGRDVQIATHSNKGSSTLTGWHQSLIRLEYDPEQFAEVLLNLLDMVVTHCSWDKVGELWPPSDVIPITNELIYRVSPQVIHPE